MIVSYFEKSKELVGTSHSAVDVHGPDALGNKRPELEESDTFFGSEPASEYIYRTCAEKSGQINLITLGPLTNIAQVFLQLILFITQ